MTALSADVVADLRRENTRLLAELRAARDRQAGSAEILSTIASAPGDAERALQQVAETTARLFGASSVTIRIARGDEWGQSINVGAGSERIAAEVSAARLRLGARNLPSTVLGENRQVHIPDLDNPDPAIADWPGIPPARAAGTRAMAGTPLRREGKAIGVLIVHRDRPEPFTAEELALQQSFADQAVIAIENARLFNETREALERQTATAEILKVIASSPSDVQPVFEAIAATSNRLIGGYSTTVFSIVDDTLYLSALTPTSPAADAALRASFPRPLSQQPWAEQTRNGEIVNVSDIETESAVPANLRDVWRMRGFRSLLLVPLRRDRASIGMISVTRREPGTFAAHHVQLLQTFADQAVIAIENVRLFEQVQAKTRDLTESLQQQTATAEVLKVISRSAFDLETVMNTLARSASELCAADLSALFLRDGNFLALRGISDIFDVKMADFLRQTRVEIDDQSYMGRSVLSGTVANIPDFASDTTSRVRTFQQAIGFRAMLIVPLMREGRGVGVFALCRNHVGAFSQRHIDLIQTFADQAVIAIENVRLFDEVQARTRDLTESLQQQTATAEVLKVISQSTFDLKAVLTTLVQSARELCNAPQGMVLLRDGDVYRTAMQLGYPAEFEQYIVDNPIQPNPHSGAGRAAFTGQVAHFPDVTADPEYRLSEGQRIGGYRTLLSIPLLREGEVIGVFSLGRTEPDPFTPRQIELVQTFADQAVIAIGNVRLFDEVQERTEDLRESLQFQTATSDVLKVISSSPDSLQPVLDVIVDTARHLCGTETSTIFLLKDERFHIAAASGAMPEYLEYLRKNPIALDQPGSSTSRAAREKRTVHIPDIGADPEFGLGPMSVGQRRALLSVPLMREGSAIGVITMRQTHLTPFTERQIEVVQTFADQAIIAISNVRLFEEVQARTRELSKSLDDLRTAQDRLIQTEKLASLGQLTAGIAHEIKNPLNFVNNFAALSAELTDELNEVLSPAPLDGKTREEVDEITHTLKDNLEKVVQHGKRADSIVKNMLLHSREGSGEHRPTDVNALLDESLNLAYHGARAEKREFNVTLQRNFDPHAGMVEVFPQEITRVLLNMISNGFYAVTKRKLENGSSGFEPVLKATTRNLGDTVEIRIRDNGIGIPDEVKEKMFNPFFTTKPAGEGTGLGLSMSHDIIVKQHGGRIDVETEPGRFTEFTIVLPRTSHFSNSRGQT